MQDVPSRVVVELYTHPACALPPLSVQLHAGAAAGGELVTVTATGEAAGLGAAAAGRAVFDAAVLPQSQPSRRWLLKLVRGAYGTAAHVATAHAGHAPALLGVAPLPGGWTAVVMEALTDGWREYDARADEERAAAAAAYDAALRVPGNVHGDLRPPNVLVRGGRGAGPVQVAFLDWDWAGAAGTATYPLGLNPAIAWPEGAAAGAVVAAHHDERMLRGALHGELRGQ